MTPQEALEFAMTNMTLDEFYRNVNDLRKSDIFFPLPLFEWEGAVLKEEEFEIFKYTANTWIVRSKGFNGPFDDLIRLKEYLIKEKFIGSIIFNLYLSNGMDESLYQSTFDGDKLSHDLNDFKSEEIERHEKEWLFNNPVNVDNSILSQHEKDFLNEIFQEDLVNTSKGG